jgi:hypothetical protein
MLFVVGGDEAWVVVSVMASSRVRHRSDAIIFFFYL